MVPTVGTVGLGFVRFSLGGPRMGLGWWYIIFVEREEVSQGHDGFQPSF